MQRQGPAQPPLPGSFPVALTLLRQQAYLCQPAPLAVPAAYSTWGASSVHLRELWLRDHYLPARRELHPVYRHEYSQMRMVSCGSLAILLDSACNAAAQLPTAPVSRLKGTTFRLFNIPLAKQIPKPCWRKGQGGRLYTEGIGYSVGNRSSGAHRIPLAKPLRSKWCERRRCLLVCDFHRGHFADCRAKIIHERSVQQLALLVIDHLLKERAAKSLCQTT